MERAQTRQCQYLVKLVNEHAEHRGKGLCYSKPEVIQSFNELFESVDLEELKLDKKELEVFCTNLVVLENKLTRLEGGSPSSLMRTIETIQVFINASSPKEDALLVKGKGLAGPDATGVSTVAGGGGSEPVLSKVEVVSRTLGLACKSVGRHEIRDLIDDFSKIETKKLEKVGLSKEDVDLINIGLAALKGTGYWIMPQLLRKPGFVEKCFSLLSVLKEG